MQHFNKDIFFRPSNMVDFVLALVVRLELDTAKGSFATELTDESVNNIYEIVKALQNLIQYQNALHSAAFMSHQDANDEDLQLNEQMDSFIMLFSEIARADPE